MYYSYSYSNVSSNDELSTVFNFTTNIWVCGWSNREKKLMVHHADHGVSLIWKESCLSPIPWGATFCFFCKARKSQTYSCATYSCGYYLRVAFILLGVFQLCSIWTKQHGMLFPTDNLIPSSTSIIPSIIVLKYNGKFYHNVYIHKFQWFWSSFW